MVKDQEEKKMRALSTTTPLSSVPLPALVKEVRTIRSKLKASEAELSAIKAKLAVESVEVDDDVKVCTLGILNLYACMRVPINLFVNVYIRRDLLRSLNPRR